MPLTKIKSLGITDGTIVNADINASAGIDSTKISGLSSDYVLLASTDASSSASVSFDGYFSSTYKNYQILISNMTAQTNDVTFYVRFRRSNADITASNYHTIINSGDGYNLTVSSAGNNDQLSRAFSAFHSLNNYGKLIWQMNISDSSTFNTNLNLIIADPLGTNNNKIIYGTYITKGKNFYDTLHTGNTGIFLNDNQSALSGITFSMSSGNITRGNFKLYGIK